MKIEVNHTVIEVESEFPIVYRRLKQFEVEEKIAPYYMKFYRKMMDIHVRDYKLHLEEKVEETDLYPIVNNVVAYLINDSDNLYIHSVVISKDNHGIMLLGDFNSGKTHIALEAEKYGYEINSADQTWICKNKMKIGSAYHNIKPEYTFLEKESYTRQVFIEKIIFLKGICKDGEVSFQKIEFGSHYKKNLFQFANWHYDMPILTKYIKLKDTGEEILSFIEKHPVEAYFVRGDSSKVVEVLCDRKKSVE